MQSPTTSSFTFTGFIITAKNLLLLLLLHVLFIMVCNAGHQGGGFSESESFFSFIRAIDPQNVLHHIDLSSSSSSHPCMMKKLKGVIRCDYYSEGGNIIEIRLEKLNLSGTIDAESLCRLKKLRVLSLAENNITGNLPDSILHCSMLSYLNLSSNHLSGKTIPSRGLMMRKLKFLRKLDISNNNFNHHHHHHHHHLFAHSSLNEETTNPPVTNTITTVSSSNDDDEGDEFSILYVMGIGIMLLFLGFYFASIQVGKKRADDNTDKKKLKNMKQIIRIRKVEEEEEEMKKVKKIGDAIIADGGGGDDDELVFFEEDERFTMEDLLEATADLRSESFCSCLYKVRLKNGEHYAVKRLKNFQVDFAYEFSETLKKVSKLKHANVLPLVGYRSTSEEKLVIYRYQNNGSLLHLFKG